MARGHQGRIKRPLPKYELSRPLGPFFSGQGCIIFALFKAYSTAPNTVLSYVINSAFWAAHALRVNTNLTEEQWDIWFLVERDIYPQVFSQFQKANLEDFVVLFDPIPDGVQGLEYKVGYKLYATIHPFFEKYKRCFVWDTDNFMSIRDPENLVDVGAWTLDSDESLIYAAQNRNNANYWVPRVEIEYKSIQGFNHIEMFENMVVDYLGGKRQLTKTTLGIIYGWNPQRLRQDFKNTVTHFMPFFPDDEIITSLYYEKRQEFLKSLSKLWQIPIYERKHRFYENDPHYFDHFPFYEQKDVEELAPIWKKAIGLERRRIDE